jgi:hypothetical protein
MKDIAGVGTWVGDEQDRRRGRTSYMFYSLEGILERLGHQLQWISRFVRFDYCVYCVYMALF